MVPKDEATQKLINGLFKVKLGSNEVDLAAAQAKAEEEHDEDLQGQVHLRPQTPYVHANIQQGRLRAKRASPEMESRKW